MLPDLSEVRPIRVQELTLGELAYFERRSGMSLADFGEAGSQLAGPLLVLAGIALARVGQFPSWEAAQEAAENLTLEQAQKLISVEDDPAGE